MPQQPFRLGLSGNIFGGSPFGQQMGSARPSAAQKTPSPLYGTPRATSYNSFPGFGTSTSYGNLIGGTPTPNPNYVNGPLTGWRQPTSMLGMLGSPSPSGGGSLNFNTYFGGNAPSNPGGIYGGPMVNNPNRLSPQPMATSLQELFQRYGLGLPRRRY